MNKRNNKGMTLVALVVTIIVLLILAGVTIVQLTGNGLFEKTKSAAEEYNKQTATEKMNLKITNLQIGSYAENGRIPTLQELADGLCEDKNDEIEYVELTSQAVAALDKIVVGDNSSIFTKLREYPYEFEIDSSLRLASVDGVKVSESNGTVSSEQYEELINRLTALETVLQSTKTELETTKSDLESSNERIATLEDETIVNKRIDLMSSSSCWLKDNKTLHIGSVMTNISDNSYVKIVNIYGIK